MPRKRVTTRRNEALTCMEVMDLTLGADGSFRSPAERRAAWEFHREELIDRSSGRRPAAWWDYDAPEPRNEREPEHEQLRRLGQLDAVEQAAVDAHYSNWERICQSRAAFAESNLRTVYGRYTWEADFYGVPRRLRKWKRAKDAAGGVAAYEAERQQDAERVH